MSELKRAIEEHKNCPCCGSEDISVGGVVASIGEDIFIKCNSCNLKMQLCKEYGWEELLKRWNTRKPMQNIVERLEEEQEKLDTDMFARECDNWHGQLCNGISEGVEKAIEIVKEEGGV